MKKLIIWLWLSMCVYEYEAVANGNSVSNPATYPYQASIWCPVIMCSGVLVSYRVVATTATCVYGLTPDQVQARLGSNLYYDGGILVPISKIVPSPYFNLNTYDYNVALLQLTTALTSTDTSTYPIAPATLCTARPGDGTWGTGTAFGAINYPGLQLPDTLQSVFIQYYGRTTCLSYYGSNLTASMFCAGDPAGARDFCPEDQGAPIIFSGKVCGIQNFGGSCGLRAGKTPSRPTFTDFFFISNWLNTNINNLA